MTSVQIACDVTLNVGKFLNESSDVEERTAVLVGFRSNDIDEILVLSCFAYKEAESLALHLPCGIQLIGIISTSQSILKNYDQSVASKMADKARYIAVAINGSNDYTACDMSANSDPVPVEIRLSSKSAEEIVATRCCLANFCLTLTVAQTETGERNIFAVAREHLNFRLRNGVVLRKVLTSNFDEGDTVEEVFSRPLSFSISKKEGTGGHKGHRKGKSSKGGKNSRGKGSKGNKSRSKNTKASSSNAVTKVLESTNTASIAGAFEKGPSIYPLLLLYSATCETDSFAGNNVCFHEASPTQIQKVAELKVQVNVYLRLVSSIETAITSLIEAVERTTNDLIISETQCIDYYQVLDNNRHLNPPPFLVRYLHNQVDNHLKRDMSTENRRRLHNLFMLPLDWPLFRSLGAITMPSYRDQFQAPIELEDDDTKESTLSRLQSRHEQCQRPINVHRGIPVTEVPGMKETLVMGDYMYFHYLQEGFPDKGWGCAYRSLQTIVSWFKLNQYTTTAVPTHGQIQEVLAKMRVVAPNFEGSSQWIGSQEVSHYLNEVLGIESKFITMNSGSEVIRQAKKLEYHFETEGTPVMCGGGALAYTILGVRYDNNSGDAEYLILDPHYVGPDDIKSIQEKSTTMEGYKAKPCSWRGAEAFNPASAYNLCCPIRPKLY